MYRVKIDTDVAIENVQGWYVEGNVLILAFEDGSVRGVTGFVEFLVEQTNNPQTGVR